MESNHPRTCTGQVGGENDSVDLTAQLGRLLPAPPKNASIWGSAEAWPAALTATLHGTGARRRETRPAGADTRRFGLGFFYYFPGRNVRLLNPSRRATESRCRGDELIQRGKIAILAADEKRRRP